MNRNVSPQVAQIDLRQWESEMTLLALLEGYATALAANHLAQEEYSQLWQINANMQQALHNFDIITYNQLNRAFHTVIYNRCPNTPLVELLQQTWDRLDIIRHSIFLFIPERGWASINEHMQLIMLLEQHAPFDEIEHEARTHKLRTREAYQNNIDPGDPYLNITDPDIYTRGVPHATFKRLRDNEPVSWWNEKEGKGFWAVAR